MMLISSSAFPIPSHIPPISAPSSPALAFNYAFSNLSTQIQSSASASFHPDTFGLQGIVVGSLDLNQCLSLLDEIAGTKPEAIGADIPRAYLSDVCVAEELHRNGLGYALLEKSLLVAHDWGISDLYVHVAVDNEPTNKLLFEEWVCL